MIDVNGVTLKFGDREVLNDITISLSEKRIAIVGSNGSGKSTFVRLLNGLQLPTRGSVQIDGFDTKKNKKEVRKKVGFVFQNPENQIVLPLVEEDLAFGMKNIGMSKEEQVRNIDHILKRYDLEEFRNHPAHLLSGGQKQLLAISGVLAMNPDYIVFDEPTTLLDLRNKKRVSEAIHNMEQTAIVVSHDLDFLQDFERVLVFDNGQIAFDDKPLVALDQYVRMMSC